MPKTVVYIGGYGRSGSTILCLLLGQLERVCSAGELGVIWAALENNRKCTCGSILRLCNFWGPVIAAKQSELQNPNCDPSITLEHLFHNTNSEIVLDATKTSWRNALRPLWLHKSGYDVYYIHMTRALRGVLSSARKGSNTDLEGLTRSSLKLVTLKTFLSRLISNSVSYFYRAYFWKNSTTVCYEQLIAQPSVEIAKLRFLTPIEKEVLSVFITSGQTLHTFHEINGNRLLRTKNIKFWSS